jgi:S-DNA-T family DNA segregation ATPase FtsK/SpoIIIE
VTTAAQHPHLTVVPDQPATPLEGVVIEKTAAVEKAGRPSWIEAAVNHATEHRLYLPWAARGYRRAGARWLDRYRDDYPHMIATAREALREADVDKQSDLKQLVRERRAEYRRHRLIHVGTTGAWTLAGGTGVTVGTMAGGLWVDLVMLAGTMLYGVRQGHAERDAQMLAAAPQRNQIDGSDALNEARQGVRGEYDLITALIKAKIITEAQRAETRVIGQIRPEGPGWGATIELPEGMEASDAIDKAGKLAGALRVKQQQIEIKADTSEAGHEAQFVLWVADNANPFAGPKVYSPLLEAGQWNFWRDGIPLGTDARQTRQVLRLIWSSILIGGLQDYGKSYLARLIAAAAALDPTVRIIVITGKTGPDWAPLKSIAHKWISGSDPDTIRTVLDLMNSTIADMQARGSKLEQLSEQDPGRCPEGKITPELAADGMGPVLLIVDELQELLDGAALVKVAAEDDDSEKPQMVGARDPLVSAFARFNRVSRYVLGMGLYITQRPDAVSVPAKLRDVCIKRASFRTKNRESSNMILGETAVKAGASPHALLENSKGVFVLDEGAEHGHITLRGDVIDLPEFRKICERGRQLRIAASTLSGEAAQREERAQKATKYQHVVAECLAVMDGLGRNAAQLDELASGVDMPADDLNEALREAGVIRPEKVSIPDKGRVRGYDRACLEAALRAV